MTSHWWWWTWITSNWKRWMTKQVIFKVHSVIQCYWSGNLYKAPESISMLSSFTGTLRSTTTKAFRPRWALERASPLTRPSPIFCLPRDQQRSLTHNEWKQPSNLNQETRNRTQLAATEATPSDASSSSKETMPRKKRVSMMKQSSRRSWWISR